MCLILLMGKVVYEKRRASDTGILDGTYAGQCTR